MPKPTNLSNTIRDAAAHGMFVLVEGRGKDAGYKTWDRKTGKWVLTYYPARKRWLGQADAQGQAPDYRSAIRAALAVATPHAAPAASGRPAPANG